MSCVASAVDDAIGSLANLLDHLEPARRANASTTNQSSPRGEGWRTTGMMQDGRRIRENVLAPVDGRRRVGCGSGGSGWRRAVQLLIRHQLRHCCRPCPRRAPRRPSAHSQLFSGRSLIPVADAAICCNAFEIAHVIKSPPSRVVEPAEDTRRRARGLEPRHAAQHDPRDPPRTTPRAVGGVGTLQGRL